jgi:transposase
MSDESLEEFYAGLLGVEWPWEVREILRDKQKHEVTAYVEYTDYESPKCTICGKEGTIHEKKTRRWRHLDSCNHKTLIEADIPRVKCKEHGVLQIPVPWATQNSRFTMELETRVCNWLRTTTIKEVSFMFGLSWDEVSGIQDRAVRRGLAKRKLSMPKHIGIDETSFQKHHEYVTVILDKDRNTVLDILQDRKAATLSTWFETQETADFKGLESISVDMWDPYIKAVRDNFEKSDSLIAFDRFHISQHLNKAVDKVRAKEHRKFIKEHKISELTGTKFEWLRNASKTDNRTGKRPTFMRLSNQHLQTARAWRIKETAGLMWDYKYLGVAEKRWKELLNWISRCKIDPMVKIGKMIRSYFWGILNAIRLRVNNAMLESINSGIQRIKRMACGYRSRERFRTSILFHFGGLDVSF